MRRSALALSIALLAAPALASAQAPGEKPKVEPKAANGDAPLAEGFPDGTKPGVIEIKKYPEYRSAVAKVTKATTSSGDLMFFSLFNHIQKNKIEMTAPVINTYETSKMIEVPGTKGEVTMEFVYESPTQGKAGPDGSAVEVKDHPAHDYLCLGIQGGMNDRQMREGFDALHRWLEDHKAEWVEDGPPRRIGYHGPMTPVAQRLWEIQIPVKPAAPK